uniref:HMA domain-containing protein n=1 Tax=Chenopodium quinoa TaxID=63459 RepID=A0A803KP18_CHEQI
MAAPPQCPDPDNSEPLKYKTWVLRVSIHCEGCKRKVKRILHSVEGVYTIDVDTRQHKVVVTGNVDANTLLRKLEKSGKHAELWPDFYKNEQQQQQQFQNQNQNPNVVEEQQQNNNTEPQKVPENNPPQQQQQQPQVKEHPPNTRVYEYPPTTYYAPPPVYAVSYNTAYPSSNYTASYYSAPPPYSYAYVHHGGDVEGFAPLDWNPHAAPPSDSFEIFSDENPNACSVM